METYSVEIRAQSDEGTGPAIVAGTFPCYSEGEARTLAGDLAQTLTDERRLAFLSELVHECGIDPGGKLDSDDVWDLIDSEGASVFVLVQRDATD